MKRIAVIGASYLQEPVIKTAKEMGLETHVFAWAANDVGEKIADYFYPISIVEKEQILDVCKKIKIHGVCTIGSDLAVITVNYIADKLGLVGNTPECTAMSTNKHLMRLAFEKNGDPSPKSIQVEKIQDLKGKKLAYPIIVKPLDRSGSRGITKLSSPEGLEYAIERAKKEGFEKKVLVEEYVEGQEYSVEYISYCGKHTFLALTQKYTTGTPHFIEMGHLEPAQVSNELLQKIQAVVSRALDSLKIMNGASHSEIKIDEKGNISIIEIAGRMGGDCIGSHLVKLTTGIDFTRAVVQIAMGEVPDLKKENFVGAAAVRYIFSKEEIQILDQIRDEHPEYIMYEDISEDLDEEITDSSNRYGMYILKADKVSDLIKYMPQNI